MNIVLPYLVPIIRVGVLVNLSLKVQLIRSQESTELVTEIRRWCCLVFSARVRAVVHSESVGIMHVYELSGQSTLNPASHECQLIVRDNTLLSMNLQKRPATVHACMDGWYNLSNDSKKKSMSKYIFPGGKPYHAHLYLRLNKIFKNINTAIFSISIPNVCRMINKLVIQGLQP